LGRRRRRKERVGGTCVLYSCMAHYAHRAIGTSGTNRSWAAGAVSSLVQFARSRLLRDPSDWFAHPLTPLPAPPPPHPLCARVDMWARELLGHPAELQLYWRAHGACGDLDIGHYPGPRLADGHRVTLLCVRISVCARAHSSSWACGDVLRAPLSVPLLRLHTMAATVATLHVPWVWSTGTTKTPP